MCYGGYYSRETKTLVHADRSNTLFRTILIQKMEKTFPVLIILSFYFVAVPAAPVVNVQNRCEEGEPLVG